MTAIVRRLAVTSSPVVPSPRVAPWTNRPALVAQADRQAVDLELGDVAQVRRGLRAPPAGRGPCRTRASNARSSSWLNAFASDSIGRRVADLVEGAGRCATDLLGRRVRRDQVRVARSRARRAARNSWSYSASLISGASCHVVQLVRPVDLRGQLAHARRGRRSRHRARQPRRPAPGRPARQGDGHRGEGTERAGSAQRRGRRVGPQRRDGSRCSARMSAGVGVPAGSGRSRTRSRQDRRAPGSTPACPPAASAQNIGRPTSTPRAPERERDRRYRARGDTPPSTQSSARPASRVRRPPRARRRSRPTRSSWRRAVVAHDDRVDAVLDGQARVLRGQDALEHERQRSDQTADRSRGSRQVRRLVSTRGDRSVSDVHGSMVAVVGGGAGEVAEGAAARSPSADRGPGSRGPAGRRSARSRRSRPRRRASTSDRVTAGIGLDIELEPARAVRRGGRDLLDRATRRRRERERDAARRRGAGRRHLPVGMARGRGPPSARSRQRMTAGSPRNVGRRIDPGDVDRAPADGSVVAARRPRSRRG